MQKKQYIEHKGEVVNKGRFEHVMALSLDPQSDYKEGVIRCITNREGDVQIKGFRDRSVLHKVKGTTLEHFQITERLMIKNESEIVEQLGAEGFDFIGLEDPDIWIDEKTGLTHLYFTMPFIRKDNKPSQIHLGHAVGKNLDSLEMTIPSLVADKIGGAKEVSIAPVNKQGFRYNLVESSSKGKDYKYSTVRVAIAENMGKPWRFGNTVFHPAENNIPWIAGHASPAPLFPDTFIEVGEGKRLGVINGREANQKIGDKIKYGMFSVGLFIYDYEHGKIEWVSPKPLIIDSKARTITFASQFVQIDKKTGILYAHVDDSFVRAYTLNAGGLKRLLP